MQSRRIGRVGCGSGWREPGIALIERFALRPARSMNKRGAFVLTLLGFVLLSGCARRDPLDNVVQADSGLSLLLWRRDAGGGVAWADFDVALQELRFEVMIRGEAHGSEEIEQRVRARIHGHTVREVLLAGWEKRRTRFATERAQLTGFLEKNEQLKDVPGSAEADAYLENKQRQLNEQRDRAARQVRDAEAKLASWQPASMQGRIPSP